MNVYPPSDVLSRISLLVTQSFPCHSEFSLAYDQLTPVLLHDTFIHSTLIGEGVQGVLYHSSELNCVIKLGKSSEEAFHEIMVNLYLSRFLLPNMNVLHDYYVSDSDPEVIMMFFPHVHGITLHQWVKTSSEEEVERDTLPILLQVIGSLASIQTDTFRYTHYDLHTANVMIQKLDNVREYTYRIGKKQKKVSSSVCAVIIDQGLASVMTKEKEWQIWCSWFQDVMKHHGYCVPAFDVFKILFSLYKSLQRIWEKENRNWSTLSFIRYVINSLFSPYSEPSFCSNYMHHNETNHTFCIEMYWKEMESYLDPAESKETYERIKRLDYDYVYRVVTN